MAQLLLDHGGDVNAMMGEADGQLPGDQGHPGQSGGCVAVRVRGGPYREFSEVVQVVRFRGSRSYPVRYQDQLSHAQWLFADPETFSMLEYTLVSQTQVCAFVIG